MSDYCDPMDCSLSGPSVHGILQARILEWLPFPSPGDLTEPGTEPASHAFQGDFSTAETPVLRPWVLRGSILSTDIGVLSEGFREWR